jgi:hypothetical protein
MQDHNRRVGRRHGPGFPEFHVWLATHVDDFLSNGMNVPLEVRLLLQPPSSRVLQYKVLWAYGYHNRVEPKGGNAHVTYDYAVACIFIQECRSSRVDRNPVEGHFDYIGIVKNIYEVTYDAPDCPEMRLDSLISKRSPHNTKGRLWFLDSDTSTKPGCK